jgi:hypothetical protein
MEKPKAFDTTGEYVVYTHGDIKNRSKKLFEEKNDGRFVQFIDGGANQSMSSYNEISKL